MYLTLFILIKNSAWVKIMKLNIFFIYIYYIYYIYCKTINLNCFKNLLLLLQLKKQYPALNLKIPAKRIFGDNFDPGISMHKMHPIFLLQKMGKVYLTTARPCFSGDSFIHLKDPEIMCMK